MKDVVFLEAVLEMARKYDCPMVLDLVASLISKSWFMISL